MPSSIPSRMWMWCSSDDVVLSLTNADCPFPDVVAVTAPLPVTVGDDFMARVDLSTIADAGVDHHVFANVPMVKECLWQFAALARVFSVLPGAHGLTPRRITDESPELLINQLLGVYMSGVDVFPAVLPEEFRSTGYGWFAPNADISQFGTLYAKPISTYHYEFDEDVERFQAFRLGWGLFQIGFEEPLFEVDWDNTKGLEGIVDQALNLDPEVALVMRSLSEEDLENIREARINHEILTSRASAEQAWDNSYALRPILTTRAIKTAGEDVGMAVNGLNEYLVPATSETRRVYQSSVRLYFRRTRDRHPSDNAGRSLLFDQRVPAGMRDRFANAVARRITEHDLGTVYRVTHSVVGDRLLVVRDAEFFANHMAAFGVEPDDTVTRVEPVA